ncbi:YrrS family protein [Bacillus kwashiorkori]|uniref:YrrS family protein n=1 Tax=Bacillus kwashiorkori TaxID=1522318 RepID=UPI000780E382|nr:DUF1510 family protein [Bacillus kwashiorkori]
MSNYYPPKRRSRVEQHSKQKKKNFVLNILIGIVFLLIIIVGASIISNLNNNPTQQTSGVQKSKDANETNGNKEDSENKAGEDKETDEDENNPIEDESEEETESSGTADEDNPTDSDEETTGEEDGTNGDIIEEESNDPNIIRVVKNPNWQPVGTTQKGEHITNYQEGSVDRKEMEKALTYATGLNEGDIILWWVGHGGIPNQNVVGTITPKDQSQTFRVYLDWIDGQGWLPTKVEQLKVNDKKRN